MPLVLKSLDAVTINGEGSVLELDTPRLTYTMQYTVSGDPSGNIHLDASLDGENFYSMSAPTLAVGTFAVASNGYLATHIRARITGMTNSATITAIVAAPED